MKRILLFAAAVTAMIGFSAFMEVRRSYIDIWQQLSISQQDARESIFDNFHQGNLAFPYSAAIKALAPGKRAAAVQEMGDFIRRYTNSPEFAAQYKEIRDGARPAAPADKEAKIKIRLAEIKHDLEENERGLKEAKGDMKKLYEATISMLKQEQNALQDPKDPQHEMYAADLTGGTGAMSPGNQQAAMVNFEKDYPATVHDLVKKRLQDFLDLTKDMDFHARLVESGGRKKFADPRLEAKDGLWKRCWRSGEETITAARAYASRWLKELN